MFHLLRLGLVLLQAHESRLPLRQFGVGQGDILDDGIALIFVLKLGSMPLRFRRARNWRCAGLKTALCATTFASAGADPSMLSGYP